jgi:hypothetical protein
VTAGLLEGIPTGSLDQLVCEARAAYESALAVLKVCELTPEAVAGAAGIAQDCLWLWRAAAEESAIRSVRAAVNRVFADMEGPI